MCAWVTIANSVPHTPNIPIPCYYCLFSGVCLHDACTLFFLIYIKVCSSQDVSYTAHSFKSVCSYKNKDIMENDAQTGEYGQ